MIPDADELDMVFFEDRLDREEFFDVVQKQYGLLTPTYTHGFAGLENYCLLPETSETNRRNLLEEAERLGGTLKPPPGERQDHCGQLDYGDYSVFRIIGTQSWMAVVSSWLNTTQTGVFETEELALTWATQKSMEVMRGLWDTKAQTIYLQTHPQPDCPEKI